MSNEAKAIKALEEIKDLAFKHSVSSISMDYISAVGELYAKAVNALAELDATPLPNDLEQAAELEYAANNYAEQLDPNSTGKQMIDAYKAFIAGHQHALSTLPDLIKKVLERAAEGAKVIMEPERCTGEMWPTSEIDKQSILDTKFDDLLK